MKGLPLFYMFPILRLKRLQRLLSKFSFSNQEWGNSICLERYLIVIIRVINETQMRVWDGEDRQRET